VAVTAGFTVGNIVSNFVTLGTALALGGAAAIIVGASLALVICGLGILADNLYGDFKEKLIW
jgi:hypothetical protein